ncbi:MAG: alkane 1-monooxygenase [Myxococcota bacterium]
MNGSISEARESGGAADRVPLREVLRHWLLHLLSFLVPVLTLLFVATGPHRWWVALAFLVPLTAVDLADAWSPDDTRQPPKALPQWPFDALLYALFAIQVLTVVLAAHLVSQTGLFSVDGLVLVLVVPGSSAFSIITAHELIHRHERHLRLMGRIMMGLVLYEHFYTEHVRGHHRRVGTPADPATARFGETFWAFFRRTVPGQLRSAWRLETARLGDVDMKPWDRRILGSRVVHGLVLEWLFAFGLLAVFGPAAFALHLVQAVGAFGALEVVNYFEHWGLARRGKRVRPVDSWDTSNKFTLYGLVGLSRHADHHAFAARPFQSLRHWEESPKLPRGYSGMSRLVIFDNAGFQRQMTAELERLKLGPFAEQDAV